jgi:mono/diheme cytochrome c family protein
MRRPRWWSTAVASLVVLAAAGCGDDGGAGNGGEALSEGESLYQQRCAVCHGDDLRGTNTGPSLLSVVYEPGHHPDELFRTAIRQGVPAHHWNFGDMPPMGHGLDDDSIDAVIAYVRSVQDAEGFEDYPPDE